MLLKGLGTWCGQIAPGLFSRQIEQVLAFLERILSSVLIDFLCKYATWFCKVTWTLCISIRMLVDSLRGSSHIYHFDLKMSLILLGESSLNLALLWRCFLISTWLKSILQTLFSTSDQWRGVLVSCWEMGATLAPVRIPCYRDQSVCFTCSSTGPLRLRVLSLSCVMRLCCIVLGHAFKLQDFWVLIANWTGKICLDYHQENTRRHGLSSASQGRTEIFVAFCSETNW